jgi:hypothetical protein
MKNCVDRESYSLTAGLALGLVLLGSGTGSDLANIPDTLHYYMVGGNIRPFCGAQKDKYKSPRYLLSKSFVNTLINLIRIFKRYNSNFMLTYALKYTKILTIFDIYSTIIVYYIFYHSSLYIYKYIMCKCVCVCVYICMYILSYYKR